MPDTREKVWNSRLVRIGRRLTHVRNMAMPRLADTQRQLSEAQAQLAEVRQQLSHEQAERAQLQIQAAEKEKLAGWWDLLPFPSHQILLADDLWTTRDGVRADVDIRTAVLEEECGGSFRDKTILDLGCCEGGFAAEFARRGAKKSVGIEARPINFERCELARKFLNLPNLEFVQADVKEELARWEGKADAVFFAGLLYHVADPYSVLELAYKAARDLVFVDTHIAGADEPSHGCSEIVTQTFAGRAYSGRFFPEYPAEIDADTHKSLIWAAWSDVDAFWPLESELVRMAKDIGFSSVEPVDLGRHALEWHVDQQNRVMLLCRK